MKHHQFSIDLLTTETATADLVLLSHGKAAADYAVVRDTMVMKHHQFSINLLTAETATADLVLLSHGMAAADYACSQGHQGNKAPSVLC